MPQREIIHEGHRQRLKKRFLQEGMEHFEDHEVLELMLYYTIPRKDTNVIAHNLLKHFGSLAQVMEAPVTELMKVVDVGENTAVFLSALNAFCRYYQVSRSNTQVILQTIEACGDYLLPFFTGDGMKRYTCCAWMQNARCCPARKWEREALILQRFPSGASWRWLWAPTPRRRCWPIITPAAWPSPQGKIS